MSALLLVLSVLQAQAPRVSASVDRVDALVGDAITLTIRVEARGNAPVQIAQPALSGLELQGSREATHVQIVDGQLERTVTRELQLVATREGTATIGVVRVVHGDTAAETAPIVITVGSAAAAAAPTLTPGIRALVDRLGGPPSDTTVAVRVVALPDSVRLGEQLDLVTLAWFRRDVRRQLRTPPTLSPPPVEGVWSYPRATPSGIVASRRIGDRWYDLFLTHQVLFPLTPGSVTIGPATVTYALPLNYSFLSRELQHQVRSESLRVRVGPQPAGGRPADFSGAAGAGLTLDVAASTSELREGAAATVTATLRGRGNVALWPEPVIDWPAGLRVYPGEVTVDVSERGDLVRGTKTFRWLVVADSAGTHRTAPPTLTYFDTDRGRYERLRAPPIELVAPPGVATIAPRAAPPPLRERSAPGVLARVRAAPAAVPAALLLVPPLLLLLVAAVPRWRRRRPRPSARSDEGSDTGLAGLDGAVRRALARLVPDAEHREARALADALRAAGVEASLATHAVRVRDRLQAAVFGPETATDAAELEAEVREIIRALEGALRTRRRMPAPVVLFLLLIPMAGAAQSPTPERLYAAGAFRAAADSFLARAAAEPHAAAHWYNAGSALYRMGEDGRALAAWLQAARLDPRAGDIRRALRLVPRDPVTADLIPVFPVTPAELWVLAAGAWLLGWLLLLPRRRTPGAVLLAVAVLLALGGWGLRARYARPVGVTLATSVPLRVAPYSGAAASRELVRGVGVRIEMVRGEWLLVARGAGRGWVRRGEVARL